MYDEGVVIPFDVLFASVLARFDDTKFAVLHYEQRCA